MVFFIYARFFIYQNNIFLIIIGFQKLLEKTSKFILQNHKIGNFKSLQKTHILNCNTKIIKKHVQQF